MGCTLSNGKIKYDPTEKFNFETSYRNKFMKLSKEHSDLIKYIDESHFNRGSEVDNEQINVLQYKIELLLTMLAMEDKSKEIVLNRMEAMKFMLISEGQSAQQLEELFNQYSAHSPTMIDLNYDIDISNAIEKTQIAFETNRDEIIHTFVDDFGSLRVSMSREEFIKALEAVNIKLSTKDLQILSLRFFDGLAISVPEFLSFFGHSSTQRLVRSASHAVTMSEENIDFSMNLLHTNSNFHSDFNYIPESVMNSTNQVSTMTQHSISKELNLSITKLVILWKHVKTALLAEFENQCNGTGRTISTAQFSVSTLYSLSLILKMDELY